MRFTCSSCHKDLNIPDQKLPDVPKFKIKCPHCKQHVVLDKENPTENGLAVAPEEAGLTIQRRSDAEQPQQEQPTPPPSAAFEPEIFPPGARVVFKLIENKHWKDESESFFQEMGYYESTANGVDEAILKVRLNDYHVIFFDDNEENKGLLEEIGQWPGVKRRSINVVLLGDQAPSFDPIIGFQKGINAYININDLDRTGEHLANILRAYDEYYRFHAQAAEQIAE